MDIIKASICPVGYLTEDAQEAQHKFVRRNRRDHARKTSRKDTMFDVFAHLLVSSDPLVSSMKSKLARKDQALSAAVRDHLVAPGAHELIPSTSDDTEEEESSEEET